MKEYKKEMLAKLYLQEEVKLKQNAENVQIERLKEEYKIIFMPTDGLPFDPAEYNRHRQRKMIILAKRAQFCSLPFWENLVTLLCNETMLKKNIK